MLALFQLPTAQTRGAGRSPAAVVRDDDDEWGRWFINSWTALMSKERRLKFAAPHASPAHGAPEGVFNREHDRGGGSVRLKWPFVT
jgi:hypothetical protein